MVGTLAVMKLTDVPLGAPIWVDLMSTDLPASHAFYAGLLGWQAEAPNEEFGGYTNIQFKGERIAGSMTMGPDHPPLDLWSMYLRVDDCAAAVARVEAAGGRVDSPAMPVGDEGIMAIVADPSGAVIGMWEPKEHRCFGYIDEPGAPAWFELHTLDFDAALPFYEEVFGWTTDMMSDTPEFRYARLIIDDQPYAGVMAATGDWAPGVPSHWQIYFCVDDLDTSAAKVVELGGQVLMPPHDSPFGRLGAFADSQGAMFKLVGNVER